MKIKILALSWRDIRSPQRGGAEVHTYQMMKCLDEQNYEFICFGPHYDGVIDYEKIDNITYIRKGNTFSVIFHAFSYYRKHRNEIDYVINQCNTHNFFTRFWVPSKKRIFYIHQLTREIWDINVHFPFSKIGKYLENLSLKLNKNDYTITVSESTKRDLIGLGFNPDKIVIIYNAVDNSIIKEFIDDNKDANQDFIYVGRYSKYKGIDAAVEAFGMLHKKHPNSKLRIVGKEDISYIDKVLLPMANQYGLKVGNNDTCDIVLCGFVPEEEKLQLMEISRALLFPSIREGWGIIVSEAAARGTPSIVYNSPGVRDAVNFGQAGYLCKSNNSYELSRLMLETIENTEGYQMMRQNALGYVRRFNWNKNREELERMIFVRS
ncbi:MAG: glycosyltransferase family 4 protein [Lachnospiraceae bacterium]|nr:glycosyltransferase family 4 protein [Lachnospiraceae bacterium]